MIINVDVDGVLRNIYEPYISIYNSIHNTNHIVSDIVEYSINSILDKEKPREFFMKHYKKIFGDAKPYENVEYLNKLKEEGHKIQIVTAQYKGLESITLDWLHKNNIEYDSIHFTHNKEDVIGDVFVDDYIYHLNRSKCNRIICMDRPYNQKWKGKRINDMKDLYEMLQIE
jgi:uncharacterized HAD superfamily protein